MNKTSLIVLAVAFAIGLTITYYSRGGSGPAVPGVVQLPESFSPQAQAGQALFEKNCQTCHGAKAAGTTNGPSLIHKIYEPSHHSDKSFHRAVRYGVQPHHWQFGQMPPIEHVQPKQVDSIIRYVRELQQANGIF